MDDSPAAIWVLRADYSHSDDAIGGYGKILERTADPAANAIIGDYRRVALSLAPSSDRRFWGAAIDGEVALGSLTLKTLSAYRESKIRQVGDSDGTALNLRRTDQYEGQRQYSQDISLSRAGEELSWLVGGSWFRENIAVESSVTSFPAVRASYLPHIRADALEVYGSADIRLDGRVKLIAALRYGHERKRFDQLAITSSIASGAALPGFPMRYRRRARYRSLSPKLAIEFRPTEPLFLYVSATRGAKSGGFNFASANPDQGFRPEHLWSYEAGLRLNLFGGKGHVNATAFHYDYSDLQVQTSVAPGVVDIGNAARASVDGIEIEANAMVGRGLRFGANLNWLDARYSDYRSALAIGNVAFDASGNRLNLAPRWSGLVYGDLRRPLGAGTLSARAEISRRSRQYFNAQNNAVNGQGAYSLVNASLGYAPPGDHWRLELFGRNLTNSRYLTSSATFLAAAAGRVGAPRTYGARATWLL